MAHTQHLAVNGYGNSSAHVNSDNTVNRPPEPLEYDVLIVGAGPAGASLACFLSSHGVTGLMVSSASGNADTPRAHITKCLRDVGLDVVCDHLATKGDCMIHTRWCHSMAGEEYARIYSWGNDPKRKGDYEAASPCSPSDLPQTLLEPALVRYAVLNGYKCRFDTSLVSFSDTRDSVLTTLRDNVLGTEFKVCSKYLFGADGARSQIVRQLNLPLYSQPGGGLAINVLVKADLTHIVEYRKGNLHWVMQPDRESPDFGWMGIVRMVKPWHEWMFILFPRPGAENLRPSREEYLQRVRELIGDNSIPAEILSISKWNINETVAEQYSKGRVFCLGDAVHRHPPFNGLGSNTCIQDAFNLAWKVAYVINNRSPPSLLSTYSIERQPVGRSVITRANDAFREHSRVWDALGILPKDLKARTEILEELSAATPAGIARRLALQNAIEQTSHEFHGLGIEMGQLYMGPGIYAADEAIPYKPSGPVMEDPVLYYERSTYPGSRLPHAWLNTAIPSQPVSTIDLSGKGGFTLFTGIGGDSWKAATVAVSEELNVPMKASSIGFRQEWEDVYFDWARVRGVGEAGAVLVRPDRFVAWRCRDVLGNVALCKEKLLLVMQVVLGLQSL